MNLKHCLLATALGAVLSTTVSAASMSAAEAEDLLIHRGYSDISMLEFENGQWLAVAIDEKGQRVDVRIDPIDEKVTSSHTVTTITPVPARVVTQVVERPVVVERVIEQPFVRAPIIVQERILVPAGGKISKDVVHAVLTGAGYYDIHDIDWLSHRGVWKAEARDATGDDREIHVDPFDARIVHVEDD